MGPLHALVVQEKKLEQKIRFLEANQADYRLQEFVWNHTAIRYENLGITFFSKIFAF